MSPELSQHVWIKPKSVATATCLEGSKKKTNFVVLPTQKHLAKIDVVDLEIIGRTEIVKNMKKQYNT